jgi:hypothetical protein
VAAASRAVDYPSLRATKPTSRRHTRSPFEMKPMAYWLIANGKQIGLPFDNLDAAKQLLLKNIGEDATVLVLVEVYDADQPMRQPMWGADVHDWIEVKV